MTTDGPHQMCPKNSEINSNSLYARMHGGHHKESITQDQTSIYLAASDTLTLVMPSQTSSGRHMISSHHNLQHNRLNNRRKMLLDPTLHIF